MGGLEGGCERVLNTQFTSSKVRVKTKKHKDVEETGTQLLNVSFVPGVAHFVYIKCLCLEFI